MAGYFLVWAAFSLAATALQWLLQQISLLSPDMKTTSKIFGSIILITTGIFQFTPIKANLSRTLSHASQLCSAALERR